MRHLLTRHPTERGFPVPVEELGLPQSHLNLESEWNYNNHHRAFSKARMAQLCITHTWSNLDSMQVGLPKDVHSILHERYSPPVRPALRDIMDVLARAYSEEEPLRFGSFRSPEYKPIDSQLWSRIDEEYNYIREKELR